MQLNVIVILNGKVEFTGDMDACMLWLVNQNDNENRYFVVHSSELNQYRAIYETEFKRTMIMAMEILLISKGVK